MSSTDQFDELLHEHISILERDVRLHKKNPAPTVPIYDLTAVSGLMVDVDSWYFAIYADGILARWIEFWLIRYVAPHDFTSDPVDPAHRPYDSQYDLTRKNVLILTGWKPGFQNGFRYGNNIQDQHTGVNYPLSNFSVFGSWSFGADTHSNEFFDAFSQINVDISNTSDFENGIDVDVQFPFHFDLTGVYNATPWGVAVHLGATENVIFQMNNWNITPGLGGLTIPGNYSYTRVHDGPGLSTVIANGPSVPFTGVRIVSQFLGTTRKVYDADPIVLLGL